MRLVMDACLIALIKIHVVRRDIAGAVADEQILFTGVFLYIEIVIFWKKNSNSVGVLNISWKNSRTVQIIIVAARFVKRFNLQTRRECYLIILN